jgi:predicted nucleic acid-binding protein
MNSVVITDSTCLIGLERIGYLDLLPALFEEIIIPQAVQEEFGISLPWLQVESPSDLGMVGAIKMLVDEGEAEAIALAYERGFQIILDDRQARSVAKNMGISMIGTVGVLVKAKQAGLIPCLKPLLNELQVNGFYLTEALKVEALKLVGEE